MRKLSIMLVVLSLVGCYATVGEDGRATGQAQFSLTFPEVLPPLVVVQPGVSVVRDYDHEVFYADNYYWVRQDQTWYRSHDHRRGWAPVEPRYVPQPIAKAPPGRYRHYRGDDRNHGDDRNDDNRGHGGY